MDLIPNDRPQTGNYFCTWDSQSNEMHARFPDAEYVPAPEAEFEFFDKDGLSAYVQRQSDGGALVVRASKKTAPAFIVRKAAGDEEIVVWTKDGNKEAVEHPSAGWMIVTRGNADGTPMLDAYGHDNTWSMDAETFRKKYDADRPDPVTGLYSALPQEWTFVQVDRNIEFDAPWGETQRIRAGGFLKVSDPLGICGIASDEFYEMYDVLDRRGRDITG